MNRIPLTVIAGPTASGKTALGVEIAKALGGEIVSADSMQVYKYMDIGTAKPTPEERGGIPHYLIDAAEPDEEFSVARFTEAAHGYIEDIFARGKLPIMVGGTGLYIDSVVNDVTFGEAKPDLAVREELRKTAEEKGGEYLFDMLKEVDPKTAESVHPNNIKRVIRAIEFYKKNGIPISEHQEKTRLVESRYNAVMLMPDWERGELYDRINRRVDIMIELGLEQEVRSLCDRGLLTSSTAKAAIGYREMLAYINGEYSLERAAELIKQNSRRYAKRQLTWFGRNPNIHRLNPYKDPLKEALGIIAETNIIEK